MSRDVPIRCYGRREKVEIVTGCPIPPDWITAWKQFHQQGFVPKIATIAKACLFPADVNALGGDLPDGITTEVWWTPYHPFKSSLTGETPQELCDAWVKETGKEWTQPLGFKYAGFEIAVDVLKRAGSLDPNALRDSLAKTDLNTIVGPIKFNHKNYSETPLVGGRWVKGKKWPWALEITDIRQYPKIKKTANMVSPIPSRKESQARSGPAGDGCVHIAVDKEGTDPAPGTITSAYLSGAGFGST